MSNFRESEIIECIKQKQECSSKEIYEGISTSISYATVKRILTKLTSENLLITKGRGKGTKYLTATQAANGIERLKTKAFQLPPNALPGTPRKVLLLKKVA